jgi:hypothetical protein
MRTASAPLGLYLGCDIICYAEGCDDTAIIFRVANKNVYAFCDHHNKKTPEFFGPTWTREEVKELVDVIEIMEE